jgi:predicted nucleic acid-binding protein
MPAGRVFVDTNLWVYAHLRSPGESRHERALTRLDTEEVRVISPQVVAEYYSVMLRNGQSDGWIQANLRAMFVRTRLQPLNGSVLDTALSLRNRHGFSFWDCQIAAAALEAGCALLLTEHLQHRQIVDGRLQIINPFVEA